MGRPTMPPDATPVPLLPRVTAIESRISELEARAPESTKATPLGLMLRCSKMPALLDISASAWSSLRARGIGPPEVRLSDRGAVLFRYESVVRWLAESERGGRLLTTAEFNELVCECERRAVVAWRDSERQKGGNHAT